MQNCKAEVSRISPVLVFGYRELQIRPFSKRNMREKSLAAKDEASQEDSRERAYAGLNFEGMDGTWFQRFFQLVTENCMLAAARKRG